MKVLFFIEVKVICLLHEIVLSIDDFKSMLELKNFIVPDLVTGMFVWLSEGTTLTSRHNGHLPRRVVVPLASLERRDPASFSHRC